MSDPSKSKSESEWRAILNPEQVREARVYAALFSANIPPQFRILREKGTERAGTGKYDKFSEEGMYTCAGCGTPLYKSATKFNSGCGWPAFFDGEQGVCVRYSFAGAQYVRQLSLGQSSAMRTARLA